MGCGSSKEVDEVDTLIAESKSEDIDKQARAYEEMARLAEAHDPQTGQQKGDRSLEFQDYIKQRGGVERCVTACTSPSERVRRACCRLLLNLSFNVKTNHELVEPPANACYAVKTYMKDPVEDIRANGLWTLVNLLVNQRNHDILIKQDGLISLVVRLLTSDYDTNTRFWALRVVCNMCLGAGSTQERLAKEGVLPPIFDILRTFQPSHRESSDNRMKFFALACLSNLTSKNSVVENMIVDQGGLPVIFALLKSEYPNIPAEAAKVITNIAVQNDKNQIKIVEMGGVDLFLPLVFAENEDAQYQAACALLNIAQNEKVRSAMSTDKAIQGIMHMLKCKRNNVQRKAAAIITVLCEAENTRKILLTKSDVEKRLIELASDSDVGNFNSLMARVRAAQALSTLRQDLQIYKQTLLDSIKAVLQTYNFVETPAYKEWMGMYGKTSPSSSMDEVQNVFNVFTQNLQQQAQQGILMQKDG